MLVMLSVANNHIMLSEYLYAEFRYAEFRYAECHYAECHYAECHYAEFRYAECHYAEFCYAECRYAECNHAEFCYAECRYAECHHVEFHYAECRCTKCRGAFLCWSILYKRYKELCITQLEPIEVRSENVNNIKNGIKKLKGTEAGLLNKKLMLSSSFRCDQIYK
jgi:uncharacterized protein YjbI with pentapeptide repeats